MKKTFTTSLITLIFAVSTFYVCGQSLHDAEQTVHATKKTDSAKVKGTAKNMIKLNLTSLALNNYSLIYERQIGRKIAAGLGVRIMPKTAFPFISSFESILDDPETYDQLNGIKIGNYSITPEVKFYFGKDVFRGFYIAPFARYTTFTAQLPFEYTYNNTEKTIPLDGEVTGITGGLLFGAQWKLSKLIYLDWAILGPHGGSSKGNISGKMALTTQQERDELKEELEDLDIPLLDKKVTVDANGASVDFTGPWAGVRASISLGFRF